MLTKLTFYEQQSFPSLVFLNLIITKSALSGLKQFLATENSLKLMKNAFLNLTLQTLLLFKIFIFCLNFLIMQKKRLD